ncbi:Cullin-domain-containing protein [Ramicandelaber brevisporus]|nr:Cullin-domain-containing protein [Ramicandelaber brevisporus]
MRQDYPSVPAGPGFGPTWDFLRAGLIQILEHSEQGITHRRVLDLYTAVYNFCTGTQMNNMSTGGQMMRGTTNMRPGASASLGTNNLGRDLYDALIAFFNDYLTRLAIDMRKNEGEMLIRFYAIKWARYETACKLITHTFRYLNRFWIKRELGDGKRLTHDINTLTIISWRDHMFKNVESVLAKEALKIIEAHRRGDTVNADLIKKVVTSYITLGDQGSDANKQGTDIYQLYFEKPFLDESRLFYKQESERFIAENSITDYINTANQWLKDEETRVKLFVVPSTGKPLLAVCEDVLVREHTERIVSQFKPLLEANKIKDLQAMHDLLKRLEDGLTPLWETYQAHVKSEGLGAIEAIYDQFQTEEGNDPKVYVEAILNVHRKYTELTKEAFRSEPGAQTAMDKACSAFINTNKLCPQEDQSKSPELLARYCDHLLKKGSRSYEESDLEAKLNSVMSVFRFIDNRDVFQKFYSTQLAKRLVNQNSASDDAEASMITKLKEVCGPEHTTKLQRMFQDVGVSKDINDKFQEHSSRIANRSDVGMDFHIFVLSTTAWPLQAPKSQFVMPLEITPMYDRFQQFYVAQHNGRKLNWLFQYSKAEIKTNYVKINKVSYTLQVSMYQLGVLLMYNNKTSYTFNELATGTGLDSKRLKDILSIFLKAKVLLMQGSSKNPEHPDTTFVLNMDFKSKRIKINLNQPIKSEQKEETDQTNKQITQDRKHLIDAAIVRVMKTRKTLKHTLLIQEVIQQLISRFKPQVTDIKAQIESLITREYVQRSDTDPNTFIYLA